MNCFENLHKKANCQPFYCLFYFLSTRNYGTMSNCAITKRPLVAQTSDIIVAKQLLSWGFLNGFQLAVFSVLYQILCLISDRLHLLSPHKNLELLIKLSNR